MLLITLMLSLLMPSMRHFLPLCYAAKDDADADAFFRARFQRLRH